jgi:hypothetical protein
VDRASATSADARFFMNDLLAGDRLNCTPRHDCQDQPLTNI